MRRQLDINELDRRIELNFYRLADSAYYQIGGVFSPADYDWYADKEGRALLAFVSHYKISSRKIDCMEQMLAQLAERMNEDGYFGPVYKDQIHEQQLSGHSWLLRGLCEHYEQFRDERSLQYIQRIIGNLYLPKRGSFRHYPIQRDSVNEGGVSGSSAAVISGWILSSDIGCAFMSIDGLSHAYQILQDDRIKELLDEMISFYLTVDKAALKAQTHCTLTAARGMMRMHAQTGEETYLRGAETIWRQYVHGGGMTATYQNLNWWGRPDSWTEPCGIVDSLMLSLELYKALDGEEYRTLAARIYHNGLASAQRSNGGAGTDSVVLAGAEDTLYAKMYEAYFCCTMRLAEGLWYIKENAGLLYADTQGQVTKKEAVYAAAQGEAAKKEAIYSDTQGQVTKKEFVYTDGDILYAEVSDDLLPYAENFVTVDGHRLCPIVKYYRVPEDIALTGRQKLLFK